MGAPWLVPFLRGSIGFGRFRRLQRGDVVRPLLHHRDSLSHECRAVVGAAVRIFYRVPELMLDEVDTIVKHLIEDRSCHCAEAVPSHFVGRDTGAAEGAVPPQPLTPSTRRPSGVPVLNAFHRIASDLGRRKISVTRSFVSVISDGLGWLWMSMWRRRWDSNPRYRFRYGGFQDRCLKPLDHSSVGRLKSER